MTWEAQATTVCEKRNLTVVGFDGGYVFIKMNGHVIPVGEDKVAEWIEEDKLTTNWEKGI